MMTKLDHSTPRRKKLRFPVSQIVMFVICVAGPTSVYVGIWCLDSKSAFRRGTPSLPQSGKSRAGVDGTPIRVTVLNQSMQRVQHAMGASTVPRHPKRLCALGLLDALVAVGVRPFSAGASVHGFPTYLRKQLHDVIPIYQSSDGWRANYESILANQPDMILSGGCDYQTYLQLSKIAPVVVLTNRGNFSQQQTLNVGMLLERRADAELAVARYDAKTAAARRELHKQLNGRRVAFFRMFGKRFAIHGRSRGGLTLYDDLKLTPPTQLSRGERGMILNLESLLDFDADYLFVAAEQTHGTRRNIEELFAHSVWQRVPAVKHHRVVQLQSFEQWIGSGLLGKSLIVDQVVHAIAPEAEPRISSIMARAEPRPIRSRDEE